jgi:hypothetical protein
MSEQNGSGDKKIIYSSGGVNFESTPEEDQNWLEKLKKKAAPLKPSRFARMFLGKPDKEQVQKMIDAVKKIGE